MLKNVVRIGAAACLAVGSAAASPAGVAGQEGQEKEQTCELEGSQILNQAEDLLNQAAKLDTTEATAAAAEAQYKQARKRIQLALQQDTANPAAYYMAGRASVGLGDYARADSMLSRFTTLEPGCASIAETVRFDGWAGTFNEGIRAYQAGDDSTALTRFEKANLLRADPRSLNNSALIHQQRGDVERAEELYRESLEASEGSKEFREQYRTATINLAEVLRNKGEREQMLSIYRDYLAQRPEDVTAKVNYAVGLREEGQSDSARAVLQTVLDRDDLTFEEQLNVGRSLMGMKSYEGARVALEKARQARPYDKTVMEQLMTASANSGQIAQASALGDTLVQWYPYQKQLFQSYVQILDQQGRADRVQQLLPAMQNMEVRIPRVRLVQKGENVYVVHGQVRGAAVTNETVTLPVQLLGPDGGTVAETQVQVQVPGGEELAQFQTAIETDQSVAGFRYGQIQRGS